jgi:hypothetical protein
MYYDEDDDEEVEPTVLSTPKYAYTIQSTPVREYRNRVVELQLDGAWMPFWDEEEAADYLANCE